MKNYRVLLALLLSALAMGKLDAQSFQAQKIQLQGAPDYTAAEIEAALKIKPGARVTYDSMHALTKELMDSGYFDAASFSFDGVVLNFRLSESEETYPFSLDNFPATDPAALNARIRAQFPLFHGKLPGAGTVTDGILHLLEGDLAAQGTPAKVTIFTDLDSHAKKILNLKFSITSPPVLVGSITTEGVSPDLQADLLKALRDYSKTPYSRTDSATFLEQEAQYFYLDRGHAAATIKATAADKFLADSTALRVPFHIVVNEGRVYKIVGLALPKDSPLTMAEARKVMYPTGSVLKQSESLRMLWDALRRSYLKKGLLDCVITPKPIFDEAAGTVQYSATVVTGPVYTLGFVKFDGFSDDLRKILLHNWQIMPGDPFDEPYAADFLVKLTVQDPTLAKALAPYRFTSSADADPVTHQVNFTLTVTPK